MLLNTRLHRVLILDKSIQWRHNGRDSVSNHQPQPFIQLQIKNTSKLRVTGLCAGNSPVTGEFHAQSASNAVNVSIWWRHHGQLWHVNPSHTLYLHDHSNRKGTSDSLSNYHKSTRIPTCHFQLSCMEIEKPNDMIVGMLHGTCYTSTVILKALVFSCWRVIRSWKVLPSSLSNRSPT